MKKSTYHNILLLSIGLLFFSLNAQSQSTTNRNLGNFSRIHVAEGIEAILVSGNQSTAEITTQGNISPREVLTEIRGNKLRVHLEDGRRYRRVKVKVKITYQKLTGIIASSAANIQIKGDINSLEEISVSSAGSIVATGTLKGNDVEIEASSAGDFEGKVQVNSLRVNVSSSGGVMLSGGNASNMVAKGSSSGRVRALEFSCESADVRVSSGASIRMNVKRAIMGRASSGGSIRYTGNPTKVNVSTSSGGSIRRR
ncbi:hypothetical protein BKI52_39530 [marine bacterium AO1-C]|nr:hypothetical protein BKI52_39530 [marine bacterium AO1-C]